jgi:hypothetical protein
MNDYEKNHYRKMNFKCNGLVINQLPGSKISSKENRKNVDYINIDETGLSKSRNLALINALADISYISDDDLIFDEGFDEIVTHYHDKYSNFDIICFKVESINNSRPKKYMKKQCEMKYIKSLKVSSYEISFKTKSVKSKNITFDENFGAGSKMFKMGEENIFLYDCIKAGLKILFIPVTIAKVSHDESTWFKGYDDNYIHDLGAVYYRMTKKWWWILAIQYLIRKRKIINNKNILHNFKILLSGVAKYKDISNETK